MLTILITEDVSRGRNIYDVHAEKPSIITYIARLSQNRQTIFLQEMLTFSIKNKGIFPIISNNKQNGRLQEIDPIYS